MGGQNRDSGPSLSCLPAEVTPESKFAAKSVQSLAPYSPSQNFGVKIAPKSLKSLKNRQISPDRVQIFRKHVTTVTLAMPII